MSYESSPDRYQKMQYRRCGRSGLVLPKISLGLWHNFGGDNSHDNVWDMVRTAFDHGITHFDLANNYGPPPGSAERNFGQILRNQFAAYRDELIISTKAGYPMWPGPYGDHGSRKYLLASLDQSLARMNIDYVDIFYSHRPDPNTPIEETMGALASAVHSGKALYVGLSNYSAEQTVEAVDALESLNVPCLIHQPNYSMLQRWIEGGLDEVLERRGVGGIAYCPLAQGQLTDRYLSGIPQDSRAASSESEHLNEDAVAQNNRQILGLNKIAQERGEKLNHMALAWVLKNRCMTSVIIGASRSEQIVDNLKALESQPFTPEQLERIDFLCKKE